MRTSAYPICLAAPVMRLRTGSLVIARIIRRRRETKRCLQIYHTIGILKLSLFGTTIPWSHILECSPISKNVRTPRAKASRGQTDSGRPIENLSHNFFGPKCEIRRMPRRDIRNRGWIAKQSKHNRERNEFQRATFHVFINGLRC